MPLKLVKRPGSDIWYLRGSFDNRRIFETTKTADRKLAEQRRAKRETELYEEVWLGRRGTVSFVSAAVAYIEFEPRSINTTKKVLRLSDHFGAKPISNIGQAQADAACLVLLKSDAAPATRVREVYGPLAAIINFCARRKWCEPAEFHLPTPPQGITSWISPDDALRLISSAAQHVQPLLHFILCTGARMSEALDLDWTDVDLIAGRVRFRYTKNGVPRLAVLPPNAIITLANIPPGKDQKRKGQVFRAGNGEPYKDLQRASGGQIKTAWATALRRAKITDITPHGLRHTWASYFYAVGKDLLKLKQEGGWKSLAMVERYAHLLPEELVPQIWKVWGSTHPLLGAMPGANAPGTDCTATAPPKTAES